MSKSDVHHSRSQLDAYEDFTNLRASDLKLRIEEMLRIKVTILLAVINLKFLKIIFYFCVLWCCSIEHCIVRIT